MEIPEDKILMDKYIIKLFQLFNDDGPFTSDLWWRTDNDKICGTDETYAPLTFLVNVNDCFYWAHSDAEVINKENFHIFKQSCEDLKAIKASPDEKYPQYWQAGLLFACRLRKMRPQGAMYKYIPKRFWHLFDECGPEREAQFGNPCDRPSNDYTQKDELYGDNCSCTLSEMVRSKLDSDEHKRTTYGKNHITHNEDAITRVLNNEQLTTSEMFQILQWVGIDLKNITA